MAEIKKKIANEWCTIRCGKKREEDGTVERVVISVRLSVLPFKKCEKSKKLHWLIGIVKFYRYRFNDSYGEIQLRRRLKRKGDSHSLLKL